MSTKKVLIVITKSNWGGAQKYVFELSKYLDSSKYTVKVMVGGHGKLVEKLREQGISVINIDSLDRDIDLKKDYESFKEILKILKDERPDILHLNSSKIGGIGSVAGRIARIPKIIFTAHGYAFNENRSFISKMIIKLVYWITIFTSHKTIAVSEAMKEMVSDWPLIEDKITVVKNGIEKVPLYSKTHARSFLEKKNEKLLDVVKKAKSSDLIWIGSVAELHHIKGFKYSIEAISLLVKKLKESDPKKKVVYTIVGDGEEKNFLQNEIERLGLKENVFLLGHIDNSREYMKAFDIFLIPSLSEGLCYVALEAGIAMLPVIATSVGGIPEVVDDMKSGILVQPSKSRDIYHALEFLINHPSVQKEQSKVLHDKIQSNFNIEKMVKETEFVYENNS